MRLTPAMRGFRFAAAGLLWGCSRRTAETNPRLPAVSLRVGMDWKSPENLISRACHVSFLAVNGLSHRIRSPETGFRYSGRCVQTLHPGLDLGHADSIWDSRRGRGLPMGKRVLKLTGNEKLLVSLDDISKTNDEPSIRETCRSLVLWYMRKGEWTVGQVRLAEQLRNGHGRTRVFQSLRKARTRQPVSKRPYYLYAIQIGTILKVGMTSNVGQRLKSFRTSAASEQTEVKHVIDLGTCGPQAAKNHEKKLHRYLGKYLIEREIFTLDAIPMVEQFQPKLKGAAFND